MALFTGKGDKGTTKFFDTKSGERVSKSSLVAETLGSLDELNSFVGLTKAVSKEDGGDYAVLDMPLFDILEEIQENLFIVQAEVAGAEKTITEEKVKKMEERINAIEQEIPPIKAFSIVGGTGLSAVLDVVRTIARRTERMLVRVVEQEERNVSEHTRTYMNRLSSMLFALARLVNHRSGVKEKNPSYK